MLSKRYTQDVCVLLPKRYTQEVYPRDILCTPRRMEHTSCTAWLYLLDHVCKSLGYHSNTSWVARCNPRGMKIMLPKRYTCYPRPMFISLGLHFAYLLGAFPYLLGIQSYLLGNVYALQEVYILQNYCTPRHIPKRLTCCPRHMRVLSKTYEPIRRAFFTIPLGVHFIPLAGVDLVQASWVTCYMSWVTCTYLLGIRLRVHLIALGSQSCVHTSWVTYTSWGAASQEV